MSRKKGKKLTIAEKLIEGLEEFADSLEAGEDIAHRFNCHKVVLDLEPTPYGPELVKDTRDTLRPARRFSPGSLGFPPRPCEPGSRDPKNRGRSRAVSWTRFEATQRTGVSG